MDRRAFLRSGLLLGLAASCSGPPTTSGGDAPTGSVAPSARSSRRPVPEPSSTPDTPEPDAPQQESSPPDDDLPEEPAPRELSLLCRDSWGSEPVGDGAAHAISGLMVHHAAVLLDDNRKAPSRMRGYQRYHQQQGWPDIAYHVGVDLEGHLYELRDPRTAGDTFTDYDPAGWFLVLADGDFDQQQPSDAQLEGIAGILAWAAQEFGVAGPVKGHRDAAATTCPGEHLYRHVADGGLEARMHEILAEGGVQLRRVCGEQAAAMIGEIEAGAA